MTWNSDIISLSEHPELFEAVLALGDRFKRTLGLFPREPLKERAEAGEVLVAHDSSGLAGYVLFRVSRRHPRRATLIHLCVDPERRGQGVARALVDALKACTRELDGIRLKCRRDYEANALWPRLGFQLLGETRGRGKDGALLDVWWFAHGSPLLTRMWKLVAEETVVVTLDANVVFDLASEEPDSSESQALMSDWLCEHVHFVVTPELNNEIGRREDPVSRVASRALAGRFAVQPGNAEIFESSRAEVTAILGPPEDENAASDIRQIAWATAGEADYFVTRDNGLLDVADQIEERIGLSIVRPSALVAEFDEIVNGQAYQPRRFEGSRLSLLPADPREEPRLIDDYLDFPGGEKKAPFMNALRGALATHPGHVIEVVGPGRKSHLLYQTERAADEIRVPLLRATNSRLAPTVLRQLLTSLAFQSRGTPVCITDRHVSARVEQALEATQFIRGRSVWFKPCLDYVGPISGLEDRLTDLRSRFELDGFFERVEAFAAGGLDQLLTLERALFPAKFVDLEIPCYIIPIRASWAAQLFDTRLAEQDLFGLPPELGFRLENVYYSAAHRRLRAPARILWYVSKAKATHAGAGALRAVSYLDEVVKGTPKVLFSRFKRLGVYRWKNLKDMTRTSADATITALKFSGTELLAKPLPWSDLQESLERHTGKGNPLQSPLQITKDLFFELYSTTTIS